MYYLVLLHDAEGAASEPGTPEWDADMGDFEAFAAAAGEHIAGGEALHPSTEGVVVRRRDGDLLVTEGAFAETAEVIGGYFVLAADDLDTALALARQIPTASTGAVEVRPMVEWWRPETTAAPGSTRWLALLHEKPTAAHQPGTPEWDAAVAEHAAFERAAGSHLLGGAALHPPEAATTIRVRDGEALISDGPFTEAAEVVGGYYELWADDLDGAVHVAGQIPVGDGTVELRPIAVFDE